MCLQEVFGDLNWEQLGIRVDGEHLSNLRFADDTALLLSKSGNELQSMIHDLDRQSRTVGLKISMQKIEVMFESLGREQQFTIVNEELEVVREHIYLGR